MSTSITYQYTGSVQTFSVPSTTTEIDVTLYGAEGGGNTNDTDTSGGLGGKVTATLSVTGGTTLYLYIGGAGTNTQDGDTDDYNYDGGWPNGGTGGYDSDTNYTHFYNGAGGGGSTDIRTGTILSTRIIVAGGGGGSGYAGSGGSGGGTTGADGSVSTNNSNYGVGGGGGTSSSGGTVGGGSTTYRGSNPGVLGVGGNATSSAAYGSGGGGGGYYGGGAGASTEDNMFGWPAGGGGGSSWVNTSTSSSSYLKSGTSATHTQGDSAATGNGSIIITYNDNLANISSVSWSIDNEQLSVVFDEAVYADTTQTLDLSDSNFNLSISNGAADVTSIPTVNSISSDKKTFLLDITISGIANGSEVLTVNPSSTNSIYNSVPNALSTSQTNNTISLIERVLPYITNTVKSGDYIIVTFNESVYPSSTDQTLDLSSSNFVFAITGGTSGGTISLDLDPTSCSNINDTTFTLGLGIQSGTSDGTEVISVTPATSSSIFDVYGNASSTTQSNNTVTLADSIGPIITDVSMSTDNSKIYITFNENVYNTDSGSGSLELSDLTITRTGGTATLSSIDSIDTTNNISTIAITLSGTADGSELITVEPSGSNTIFDSLGNASTTTQTNNTVYLNDKTLPTITAITLEDDNSAINVTISETVYNTNGGSGSLTVNSFVLSYSGGTATVDSVPSSISESSNVYTLGLNFNGTVPDGSEEVTVDPSSSSPIYDEYGNAMAASQSNNTVTLNDEVAPYITGIQIPYTNDSIAVTFNETVYSTAAQTGSLTVNDLSLNIVGGVATVASTPTSISLSGLTYTLGYTIDGNSTGDELLQVSPVVNSIYDTIGNVALVSQSNNTGYLNAPRITAVSLDSDNENLTITFNVNVFNTDSGSGTLEKTDFILTIFEGSADLSSSTAISISGSGTNYVLELPTLIGTPNGQEILVVNPVDNTSIYDSYGNPASNSQQNNSINLTEKIAPFITATVLQYDNTSIDVTFSEVVYDTNSGSGILEVSDLSLNITGGAVSLTSTTPTGISTSDNITFTLNLGITGTSDGSEILTVVPIVDSIYDQSGNVCSITQSNNSVTLNEKIVPTITNISINNDNSIITVTFNENVFNSSSGIGNLEISDFAFSCSVAGVLASTTPTSISYSGNVYSLGLSLLTLNPSGQEVITVLPYSSTSIYDSAGNAASTTQSNNTVSLREQSAPVITGVSITSDNSLLTVTFDDKVYNTDSGSGNLEISDFILSITNGYSSLAYDYPYSITPQSDLSNYVLGIPLTDKCDGNEILTVNPRNVSSIYDIDGNYASVDQFDNTVTLNHTLGPIITASSISSDYNYVTVDFSENVYADVSEGTSIYQIDNSGSDVNSGIIYNTPENFSTILSKSISVTTTAYSTISNLDRILVSPDSGTYLSIDDSFDISFNTLTDTYFNVLRSTFHLVEETDLSELSGYYRLDSELHGVYSLDIIEDKLVFNNAWDINRSTSIENSNYSGGYVVFDISFSSGSTVVATLRPYARVKYSSSSLVIDKTYDDTGTSETTSSIIYNTPSNFDSIMSQSISVTLTSYNSLASLDRIMISIDGGTTYLSINDSYQIQFTTDFSTYGNLLKSTFHLVEETDVTGYTGYYRLDSEIHPNYSLDIVSNQLVFSNAWDINRTSNSDGYVLFEIDLPNNSLNPKYRLKYNSSILSTKIAFSLDSTYSSSNYLYYNNSSITLSSYYNTSFTFKKSNLDLTIPLDFNPDTTQRVSNKLILFENISPAISSLSNSYLYGGTSSQLYLNTNSTYQPQIENEGTDTTTASEAEIMLDNIISALALTSETLRYDKEVYIAFRDALLSTKLKSYGVINGELDQNCVPYVYFTNETDDDGIYHPFMVIATYAIADKPNRLIDVPRPPGEGGVDYADASVTRSTTLANFLIKIPMKDYGNITNITDNDLTSTGTNNLRDDANSSDSYSQYNYASISSIGIAIDGVTIYPVLNNTLTPAQEAAEITNTGIHVGQGLQLHYHADGHSATGNGLNLYNISDYTSQDHPPLIGFGYDGIALFGKYESSFSSMDGYSTTLDSYGGHTHGDYGYHYHAHTANSVTEGLSTTSYNLHILLKGAWYGSINNIPDFWNTTSGQPKVTPSSNQSQYTGYKDYTGNSYTATTSTGSSAIYLKYDSTNFQIINDISDNETTFNLYTSDLSLNIPDDFNPLTISRVTSSRILLENITPSIENFSDSNFYNQSSSILYSNTHSKYQPQILYSGDNTDTETDASNMLDNIQASLENEGTSLRYEKNIYLAFRKAMLNTTLKSHGVVNGVLNENTVPFVYFTNETDDDGIYHPFMVIATHGIPDKPSRLNDVASPIAESTDTDAKIFRDAAISDYLFKIPLKDYGNITTLTENDLTVNSGYNNLRDSANSTSSYTIYNYSSVSAVGIAIDGVPIYPVLNDTLTPVQEQAQLSNTGIHTSEGLQLKYHADGHSASGNNLNLYNTDDYTGNYHPPLIGFSLDGIALYGKYESSFSDMSGYSESLDSYGGHIHDDYGYHYHAHTSNSVIEDLSTNSYDLHILLKGAWYGLINNIPEFWNSSGSPNYLFAENTNQYVGNSSYSILNSSSSTIIASGNLDIYDFKLSLFNGTASLSSTIPNSISNSGFKYTLGVSIIGTIDGNEKLTVYPNTNSIYDSSGNVALLSNQASNIITLTENIVPTLISSEINSDNTIISVTFSEEVYNTSSGTGELEVNDFNFSITGGTATLTSNTPTSISSLNNIYYLGITLNGTPDGDEIITILPLSNSIFDKNSNVLSDNQSNNVVSLNKKTLPEISSVSIDSDNTFIIVNFSEEVYSTANMTGNLTRGNFNLSLSGGSATLSSATPLSIYKVNPYYLGINIIGTPNGNENLSVVPNGIYDSVGNLISSTQTSNNVNIIEKVLPHITSTTISEDNTILTVTFNELVYNNSTATEPLNINNFSLHTNSNNVLKSTTPMSVTQDGLSYLLILNLGSTPKTNDYIQVTLSTNTIYDVNGNLASDTQSNNIAFFNTIVLQDEQLITVLSSQSRINKRKIIGNSAKSKYSNPGVNTAAPVNN